MGNRALVVFHSAKNLEVSPVAYLHWDGSHVPELLTETRELMRTRGADVPYTFARFIGIVHEFRNKNNPVDNLSLGAWNAPEPKTSALPYPHGSKDPAALSAFKTREKARYRERLRAIRAPEFSHGDAGVILVNVDTWECEPVNGYLTESRLAECAS